MELSDISKNFTVKQHQVYSWTKNRSCFMKPLKNIIKHMAFFFMLSTNKMIKFVLSSKNYSKTLCLFVNLLSSDLKQIQKEQKNQNNSHLTKICNNHIRAITVKGPRNFIKRHQDCRDLCYFPSYIQSNIQSYQYSTTATRNKQKMFDKAQCLQNCPPLAYYPSLNMYLPPEAQLFQRVIEMHQFFEKEMNAMKQEVSKLTKNFCQMKAQLEQCKRSKKKAKSQQIKKFYKKDKACQHEGCEKKYSSQIALNAHIKKFHRLRQEDSSEYVL